ncbi:cytochrome c553 (plastid) [Chondrus crispus]|uniref:Cytochrome c6 n=1 Tax=Chondrus crispus TaxID=2769 RepID=M5DDA6_CHOCR|nr:cytochrome c553 [Chondrus crispus]CCP38048.1 cytochrome c553 [Chondrus crispus]|eukprot:YP_007627301.1 cytochrome c553 (plastid) [Chondrus crispus]
MKLISTILLIFSIIFTGAHSILAADLEAGEQVFSANCAACHAGGKNVIMPDKTLQKDILAENGMNSISAITKQVNNGKNSMPAFGGRLADDEIENVANYVLNQSEQGW